MLSMVWMGFRVVNYSPFQPNNQMKSKRGSLLHQIIVHLVLVGLVFGMFYIVTVMRVNSRFTKQQILERQTALLIDASSPKATIFINKFNENGKINSILLRDGRVVVEVEGLKGSKGYPYFSKYGVSLEILETKYVIHVNEK